MPPRITMNVKELRDREQIREILVQLEDRDSHLKINPNVRRELKSYMDVASSIPRRIDLNDRASVTEAQEALVNLQSRVDRVLQIQLTVFRVTRALGKLEILARNDIATAGEITSRTSGSAMKQIVEIVVPELAIQQQKWGMLERLIYRVQDHLGNAKETIKLQIQLDQNINWNRRYSGG